MSFKSALLVALSCTLFAACDKHHGSSPPDGGGDGGGPQDAGPPPPSPSLGLTFETGPVRPVALSADGTQLFVANTPDGYLEILSVTATTLTKTATVPVGMEPVAVAVRTPTEVWVVNQLSDSISIVDLSTTPPRVARTLLVGDDPSDIVFAGTGRNRAFITTAHRGQRRTDAALAAVPGAGDPQLTTAGVGRADVWAFDATQLGADAGGVPVGIVTLGGETPRALAVTPDGSKVYAAIFHSGNQTTVTSSELTCDGFTSGSTSATPSASCVVAGNTIPGPPLGPGTNYAGLTAPRAGTIVKQNGAGAWLDSAGRDWSAVVMFSLADTDVFAINASTLAPGASFAHVGTTLFNMAVNPVSGNIYVSNTDSRNDLRFEGPGTYAGTTLQGHLAESRITVLSGTTVTAHHLNKHIDYTMLPAPAGTASHSLATPTDVAVSADGMSRLYDWPPFGSGKVGVFPDQHASKPTPSIRPRSAPATSPSRAAVRAASRSTTRITACSSRRASTTASPCSI